MEKQGNVRFITDCDDTLIQTYVPNQPPVPGAEEFLRRWGPETVLLSVGEKDTQIEKLTRANLTHFHTWLIVSSPKDKADRIHDVARVWRREGNPVIMIGDRLDYDIAPAKKAGLVAVRMRHPYGKEEYRLREPRTERPEEWPDLTVTNFNEFLEKLPLLIYPSSL